jgi:hypothetical protein
MKVSGHLQAEVTYLQGKPSSVPTVWEAEWVSYQCEYFVKEKNLFLSLGIDLRVLCLAARGLTNITAVTEVSSENELQGVSK